MECEHEKCLKKKHNKHEKLFRKGTFNGNRDDRWYCIKHIEIVHPDEDWTALEEGHLDKGVQNKLNVLG